MNKFIYAFLLIISMLVPITPAQAATVKNLSWSQLQAEIRNNPSQNVIIEFYTSKSDGLECDRCSQQEFVFRQIASAQNEAISFVRIDVADAEFLKEIGIVGIYPTHLFVRHAVPKGQEMVAKRIRGFLSADDFRSLIKEFFEIEPGN